MFSSARYRYQFIALHALTTSIHKTVPDSSKKYFSEAGAAEKKKRLKHRKTLLLKVRVIEINYERR